MLRRIVVIVIRVAQEFLGVMQGVGSGLASVEVWGWDPFGVTVGAFSGGPAAGFDQSVLGAAAQGQLVDVGGAALGLVGDVVDLAVVAGHITAGSRTAAIFGV